MTIYVRDPQITAGYLDTSRGETYCHSVWRMFRGERHLSEEQEISFEDFLKICPLEKEKIESIFADGKYIVNRFEDIYNGKETGIESWIWGHMFRNDNEEVEMKALDGKWYDDHTYNAFISDFNKTFKKTTI